MIRDCDRKGAAVAEAHSVLKVSAECWLATYGPYMSPERRLFVVYLPRENSADWRMQLARKESVAAVDAGAEQMGLALELS